MGGNDTSIKFMNTEYFLFYTQVLFLLYIYVLYLFVLS